MTGALAIRMAAVSNDRTGKEDRRLKREDIESAPEYESYSCEPNQIGISCIGYNETYRRLLSSKNNSHLVQDHQRRVFRKLGRGDVRQRAHHVEGLVEAVVAGDGGAGELVVVVDD